MFENVISGVHRGKSVCEREQSRAKQDYDNNHYVHSIR